MGYLDLRHTVGFVWHRMFTKQIPPQILAAAETNVALVGKYASEIHYEPLKCPQYPHPIDLIADALHSGELTLFIYPDSGHDIVRVPSLCTKLALERVGILRSSQGYSRESIARRFMDFYPSRILDAVNIPRFGKAKCDRFAFCLREKSFHTWLANTAHRLRWPFDARRQQGPGRPGLVDSLMPTLRGLVESGRWQQGMLLNRLVGLIQMQIKGAKGGSGDRQKSDGQAL